LFGAKAALPKEIRHRSLRISVEAPSCPSEAKEKDLFESDRLKVVANLQKYQDDTRQDLEGPRRLNQKKKVWAT
jgi:hypothetical protein